MEQGKQNGLKLANVNQVQVFVIISNTKIKINADVNVKN